MRRNIAARSGRGGRSPRVASEFGLEVARFPIVDAAHSEEAAERAVELIRPHALFITDAVIDIFSDLEAKRDIIQNAIDLFIELGLGTPRVALLSAAETVTSKIPSTIDVAALCKMADRGQITGGLLDGPLAFDNAIDPEAARIKGIKFAVAGRAQILVAPDLEAGIVSGARVPIILTSGADLVRTRRASCAIAVLYAAARRRLAPLAAA